MQSALLATLAVGLLAASAMAGPHFSIFVNAGHCGPRLLAPPVCHAPPIYATSVVCYAPTVCAPRVIYAAPVRCAPALVNCAPIPVYRAPIVTTTVTVGGRPFCWR